MEKKLLVLCHLIFVIIINYTALFATHFTLEFTPLKFMDQYQLQANGFSVLSTELRNEKGEPIVRKETDASVYKGKKHSAYGALPTVFQLVLNNILHLNIPSPEIVYVLDILCLYLFFWFAIYFLTKVLKIKRQAAILISMGLSVSISLSDRFLHNVVVGYAWTQAGVTSQIFLLLSLLFLIKHFDSKENRFLFLSGVFAGCACLGKQNYIFGFLATVTFIFLRPKREKLQKTLRKIALYLTPVGAALILILIWNYIRFDSPFEAGLRFSNASDIHPTDSVLTQWHRIPFNIYNHFLAGVRFRTDDFPLFVGQTSAFGWMNYKDGSGGLLHNQPMLSMFISSPLLIILPIYFALLILKTTKGKRWTTEDIWWGFFMAVNTSVFFYYLISHSAWTRYQFDIWFLSYLCVAINLIQFFRYIKKRWPKRILILFIALCTFWSTLMGIDQTLGTLTSKTYPFLHWSSSQRDTDSNLRAVLDRFRIKWLHAPL